MQMTIEQMLEHIKPFNQKVFKNMPKGNMPTEFSKCYGKIERLLKKFGFKLVGVSRWNGVTYKLESEDFSYISVRIDYVQEPGFEYNTDTFTGILHINEGKPAINPKTGRPWAIGDVDSSNPNYTKILTKDGWWSGD